MRRSSTMNATPNYSPPPRLTYQDPYNFLFGIEDDIVDWPVSPVSENFEATQATRTGALDSRRPFGGTLAPPFGLAGSARPPASRFHILFFGNDPLTGPIPRNQWNTATPPRLEVDSRLTRNEQKGALQKLKKEIYNPFRRISQRVNLYYRDTIVKENEMAKDEDSKRCAICLEDFEPRKEATVTPCRHMFHEECIVPWVKSNGRCPVCRFSICD